MKRLLRLDASIRVSGSYTRRLTDVYEAAWLKANSGGEVIRRCLVEQPVPHLTQEAFEAFGHQSSLSERLIAELKRVDHVLIGSPLYNLSLSSSLKAYFDHVVCRGTTFVLEEGQFRGLLEGISATVITARGGVVMAEPDDHQTQYLIAILNFIGISEVDVIAVEGSAFDGDGAMASGQRAIAQTFASQEGPQWVGSFEVGEKHEISRLRMAQAEAIVEGDAQKYASLCTDDVQLLIPYHGAVVGVEELFKAEQALFSTASFESFTKYPVRVERSGDLAIEVGRQEVAMRNQERGQGVFASTQKYTHVYRNTGDGWRFAVLMSNSCG